MKNNIETKWLKDFIVLADLKHFSQAATARNITQPAFSRRIKMLETELGSILVDRSKTPIELTVFGKQFKNLAQSILFQLDEEISRLSGCSLDGHHTVRISAAHSIAIDILPRLHSLLLDPTLLTTLNIDAKEVDDAVELLKDDRCDFLFSFYEDKLHMAPYRSLFMGSSYLHCVCGQDENGEPLFDLTQGENVPFIDYTPESYMGKIIQKYNGKLSSTPIFYSSMTHLIKALVLQGRGVSWLPEYAIQNELKSGQLVILKEKTPIPLDIYAYRYSSKLHSSCEIIWQGLIKNSPMKKFK